jgi:hypothetical protein
MLLCARIAPAGFLTSDSERALCHLGLYGDVYVGTL